MFMSDHNERQNNNTIFWVCGKVVIPYLETVETNQNYIHKKLGTVEIWGMYVIL